MNIKDKDGHLLMPVLTPVNRNSSLGNANTDPKKAQDDTFGFDGYASDSKRRSDKREAELIEERSNKTHKSDGDEDELEYQMAREEEDNLSQEMHERL